VADNYTINQRPITLTANAGQAKTYGNADAVFTYAIEANGTNRGLVGGDTFSGALARAAGETVGAYAINQGSVANGNYAITYVADNYTINQRPITLTATAATKIYGNVDPSIAVTIASGSLGSVTVSDTLADVTGTLSRTAGENVGNYNILLGTGSRASNYAITYTTANQAFAITQRPITLTADAGQAKTYGNADAVFTYAIEANGTNRGLVGSDTFSGALARAAGETVGAYAINQGTVANSNYAITYVADNYTINQRPITLTATAATKIYGNVDPSIAVTIASGSLGSVTVSDTLADVTGTLSRTTGENVGNYNILLGTGGNVGSRASNYAITYTTANQAFAITQRPITLTADAGQAKTYGNADAVFTYAIEANGTNRGLVGSDTFTGALARAAGETVGAYAINQGTVANSNYAITYVADNYTINQKALTVTATSQSSTYGTALVLGSTAFTTSGLVANTGDAVNNVSLLFNALNTVPASNNAGTYTNGIVVSGASGSGLSNYSITYVPADLVMNKATLTVTPDAKTKTYGDANPVLTQTITGFVNGENLATSGVAGTVYANTAVTADTAVGTHVLVGNNVGYTASNYDFATANGAVVIARRGITVTADNTSRVYGSANPTFTYTVAADGTGTSRGLHGADSLAGLPTTVAVANTSVGTAAITQGGVTNANNSNYDITFVNGTMTINKARLVAAGTKVYDGLIEFDAADLAVTGVLGQTFAVAGSATMQTKNVQANQALANVNGLSVTEQNNGLLSNYQDLAPSDTRVTVTPRPVTLSAPVLNKTYDGGYTYNMTLVDLNNMSGQLANGDRVASANVVFSDVRNQSNVIVVNGKDVGQNKLVTISGVVIDDGNSGANYNVSLVNNNNSNIIAAPLYVKAVNDAKFSGQADVAGFGGAIINGFVNGETVAQLSGALSVSRSNAGQNAVGVYTGVLVPAGLTATNYDIHYTSGDYSILGAGNALVRVAQTNAQYTDLVNYLPRITAQYFNGTAISNLNVSANSGIYTITGGAGSASFAVTAVSPVNATSGNLSVGGYNLNKVTTTNAFAGLTLVGSLNVTPKVLDVSNLGITSVTKVYDGGTNISGLSLNVNAAQSAVVTGDLVGIAATGTYGDKNVGANKSVDINVVLSGADAANYALSSTRVTGNYGTITQLASVAWVGPVTGGRWSNASNWLNGALPDLNNVAQVIIPTGVNVLFDSALVGQVNSNIVNSGTITFNGVNNFDFNGNVSGAGNIVQSGLGVITMSGNNTLTGSININGSSLILASFNATGGATVVSNGGTLLATATLAQLTTNGAISLGSNIHTVGAQTYNGPVTLKLANTSLISDSANITFNNTLDAGAGSYASTKSLVLTANNGAVTFNGDVGNAMATTSYSGYNAYQANSKNIYRLDVNARNIALNADVTTFENQTYTGAIAVGDNGKVGTDNNGLVRTLISTDPSITFDGTVDDTTANTHTLIVKAIAPPNTNQMPVIDFRADVGVTKQLAELKATVGMQDIGALIAVIDPNPNRFVGAINIAGNISTMRDQTYTADVVNISNSITLASRQGNLVFNLGTDPVNSGLVGTGNNTLSLKTSRTGAVTGAGNYRSLSLGESKFVEPNLNANDFMGGIRNMISIAEISAPREVKGQARVEVGESMLIQGNKLLNFDDVDDEAKLRKQKADCALTANEDCAASR
jgi:hypothetical protein